MIHSFALEIETRKELDHAIKHLWEKLGVTGELEASPLEDGRWLLTVHSEKPVRDSTIDSLPGKRVKAKSIISRA